MTGDREYGGAESLTVESESEPKLNLIIYLIVKAKSARGFSVVSLSHTSVVNNGYARRTDD